MTSHRKLRWIFPRSRIPRILVYDSVAKGMPGKTRMVNAWSGLSPRSCCAAYCLPSAGVSGQMGFKDSTGRRSRGAIRSVGTSLVAGVRQIPASGLWQHQFVNTTCGSRSTDATEARQPFSPVTVGTFLAVAQIMKYGFVWCSTGSTGENLIFPGAGGFSGLSKQPFRAKAQRQRPELAVAARPEPFAIVKATPNEQTLTPARLLPPTGGGCGATTWLR